MNQIFKHSGYQGSIEIDIESGLLHGKVLFVKDLITYEASTIPELKGEFEAALDDYLETCKMISKDPDQPFNGSFNVRVGMEIHRAAAMAAHRQNVRLNEFVRKALEEKLESSANHVHVTVTHHQVIVKEETSPFNEMDESQIWETTAYPH